LGAGVPFVLFAAWRDQLSFPCRVSPGGGVFVAEISFLLFSLIHFSPPVMNGRWLARGRLCRRFALGLQPGASGDAPGAGHPDWGVADLFFFASIIRFCSERPFFPCCCFQNIGLTFRKVAVRGFWSYWFFLDPFGVLLAHRAAPLAGGRSSSSRNEP